MEITNEIKAKVFAQYWGQKCLHKDTIPNLKVCDPYDSIAYALSRMDNEHNHFESYKSLDDWKLILKPLSSITDEDATELACIHKWKELWEEDGFMDEEAINRSLIEKGNDMVTTELFKLPFKGYQFLQSKGYDLPQYLLGGKTLKEAGLAIYE